MISLFETYARRQQERERKIVFFSNFNFKCWDSEILLSAPACIACGSARAFVKSSSFLSFILSLPLFLFTSFFLSFSSFWNFLCLCCTNKEDRQLQAILHEGTRDVHRHTIETIRLESRENEDRTEKERKKQKRERAESQKGTEVRIEMFTNLSSHKSTQVYALCQLVFITALQALLSFISF